MYRLARQSIRPPVEFDADGHERLVGVEIEQLGVPPGRVAELVAEVFGGTPGAENEYRYRVEGTRVGDFTVELDFELLHRLAAVEPGEHETLTALRRLSGSVLELMTSPVVPVECVTPPLAFDRLRELDQLTEALRRSGAQGTDDALLNVLAVQFNPDVPSRDPSSILSYLRAFVLLYDWLIEVVRPDAIRRITPFIARFPERYVRQILAPGYRPDAARLIDDYLRDNPTRNRALDMLPLFAHMDPARVFRHLPDPRIHPRPTFHYRMANSRVGLPGWRVSGELLFWQTVEDLAETPEALEELVADYRAIRNRWWRGWFNTWRNHVERKLAEWQWIVR